MSNRFLNSTRHPGLLAALAAATAGCASVDAGEHNPAPYQEPTPYVDASVDDIIRKAVVTTALLPDGRTMLITADGRVLDASRLPRLELPGPIEAGTNTVVGTSAVFAVEGSPVEIRANFGFGVVCYVVDNQTGTYLGSCPKSKYR